MAKIDVTYFCTSLGDHHPFGDAAVRPAFGDEREHLALALGERPEKIFGGSA